MSMVVQKRAARAHVDIPLILMAFSLAAFGVLAVAIATYTTGSSADNSLFANIVNSNLALRQSLFILISFVIVPGLLSIPYAFLRRSASTLFAMSCVLLLVVWVFNRAQGVKAWMDIIWGFTIQPSEFAKLSLILVMAKNLSREDQPMRDLKSSMPILVQFAIPAALILVSGETGSFMVMAFLFALMVFFSNVPWKTIGILAAIVIVAGVALFAAALVFFPDDYRVQRILAFADTSGVTYSDTYSYQQDESKMAIGAGGMFGIGMFVDGALSQLNYVPADWTDFIYATIGEAFGFVGCAALLLLYFLMIGHMLRLAYYTQDKFGRLIIIGVMGMLLFHVFENIGMTIGRMPITGIPLPFISYGGSNMITNMGGVGLVLNVVRNRRATGAVAAPQFEKASQRYHTRFEIHN